MGRFNRIAAIAAVFLFSTATFCFSAEIAKIGIVDFQKVLTTSSAGKISKVEINKKGSEMEEDLKTQGNAIEELKKQIDRESLVMSAEKNEEKQRELRIKINDFKTMKANYTKQFQEMEYRLISKIKNETLDIAKNIGKADGFLLILEKGEAGVLYSPESIDITDKLIKEYNKISAKE
ncbi:MAG: OmpH family outer membrane protein [Pseudomonadota bacterium]